jgi:hypothetical protein
MDTILCNVVVIISFIIIISNNNNIRHDDLYQSLKCAAALSPEAKIFWQLKNSRDWNLPSFGI